MPGDKNPREIRNEAGNLIRLVGVEVFESEHIDLPKIRASLDDVLGYPGEPGDSPPGDGSPRIVRRPSSSF